MPSVDSIKAQLESVTTFLASLAYKAYTADLQVRATGVQNSILARPPITDEDRGAVLLLHGALGELKSNLSLFEELRDDLASELGKVQDETNDTPTQT